LALAVPLSRFTSRVGGGSAFFVRLLYRMKNMLFSLLFLCICISANAQSLVPLDVLKQDGVLRISDGSSYWEFNTNNTFRSFPISKSIPNSPWVTGTGRTFDGTWTSRTNGNACIFTVKAKSGWDVGLEFPGDDYKIVIAVYTGERLQADTPRLANFDCYWIIEELTKITDSEK
jgi:hypothetical protein